MSAEHGQRLLKLDTPAAARMVARASEDELLECIQGPLRGDILAELFRRMVEQFRPAQAAGIDAVVQWKVFDRPGGGYDLFELVIRDRTCTLSATPGSSPDVTYRVPPVDLLKLWTGNVDPTRLMLGRRLQMVGDLHLGRRVLRAFEIPQPGG